jgi:hypothetical protein
MSERRWVGPALLLAAVALIGIGIAGMLRVSYIQRPSWAMLILPIVVALAGCAMLLIPLLRRLSREDAEQEEADRRAAGGTGRHGGTLP